MRDKAKQALWAKEKRQKLKLKDVTNVPSYGQQSNKENKKRSVKPVGLLTEEEKIIRRAKVRERVNKCRAKKSAAKVHFSQFLNEFNSTQVIYINASYLRKTVNKKESFVFFHCLEH